MIIIIVTIITTKHTPFCTHQHRTCQYLMETIGAPLLSIQGNRSRHGQYMATEGWALRPGPGPRARAWAQPSVAMYWPCLDLFPWIDRRGAPIVFHFSSVLFVFRNI